MTDFKSLLARWPDDTALAADLQLSIQTLRQMKWRNYVQPSYWDALIASAQKHGVDGVSYQTLGQLAARAKARKPFAA